MTPLEELLSQRQLPVRFRGYARETTDELLQAVEEGYHALVQERDAAREQLHDLREELERHEAAWAAARARERAIGEALIVAAGLKSESEQTAAATVDQARREADAILEAARRDAEATLRDAEARAAQLVELGQQELGRVHQASEERQQEAGELLRATRDRLTVLMDDLLGLVAARRTGGEIDALPSGGGESETT